MIPPRLQGALRRWLVWQWRKGWVLQAGCGRSLGAAATTAGPAHPRQQATGIGNSAGAARCLDVQGVQCSKNRTCGRESAGLGGGSLAPECGRERLLCRGKGLGVAGFPLRYWSRW